MMDILLLGVSLFVLHVAALEGMIFRETGCSDLPHGCSVHTQERTRSFELIVSIWPKGSEIYQGESVLLQCSIKSNSTFGWTYQWYRSKPHTASTPNFRHIVSGDCYTITAVRMEDAGRYWCKAEQRGSNTTVEGWVMLNVSERTTPSMTLTPSSRQVFSGESFTVQCPASKNNSAGWKLKHFSPGESNRNKIHQKSMCSQQGGAADVNETDKCGFTADQENSGLYWCEGGGGRSSSINITVSFGEIILKAPAFPVSEGDKVVLSCQHRTRNPHKAVLYKDGMPFNSSSWTIAAATTRDEGFYKCVSQIRKMESPQGWLSVIQTHGIKSKDVKESSTNDVGKWIVSSICVFLLLLLPLIWLIQRSRYLMICTGSCWPLSKESIPPGPLPATKQDVTEVQWDLSWMEMSNLLDKQFYPGTEDHLEVTNNS